jgi:ACS family hexuronate transporter-like MFS transporter
MPTDEAALQQKPAPSYDATHLTRFRWVICVLLFFGTTLNYVDRQSLGFLGARLDRDLGIGDAAFGKISAAFAIAYAIGQTFAGRWLDKVGTRVGYAISLSLWSITSILHGFCRTALQFGVARVILGIVESPCYPASNKTAAEWFPKRERSTVMGFVNAGANVGVIIAAMLSVPLYARYGFRGVFLCTGGLGFIWLAFWIPLYRRPHEHPRVSPRELEHINSDPVAPAPPLGHPPTAMTWALYLLVGLVVGTGVGWLMAKPLHLTGWGSLLVGIIFGLALGPALCIARPILPYRQTWAFAASKFITDAIWYFFITWIAKFLFKQHQVDIQHLGLPFIIIYSMADLGSIAGGGLASYLIRRGLTLNVARKLAMAVCIAFIIPVCFATAVANPWTAIILLGMATAGHQGFSANQYSIVGDLFPKRAVGSVSGFGGTMGYIGASLYAVVCGAVLAGNHADYTPLMIVAGTGYVAAFVIIQLLSPTLQPAAI